MVEHPEVKAYYSQNVWIVLFDLKRSGENGLYETKIEWIENVSVNFLNGRQLAGSTGGISESISQLTASLFRQNYLLMVMRDRSELPVFARVDRATATEQSRRRNGRSELGLLSAEWSCEQQCRGIKTEQNGPDGCVNSL